LILRTLNIKDHISEIISISNLQFTSHFIENTNIINYIPKPNIYNLGLLNSFLIGLIIGKFWLYFNKSFIVKFFINNVNIYILKYISRKILNISLFWKLFLILLCVFILIDAYQILYCNNLSFNYNYLEIVLNMVENNKDSVVDVSNSVVNVQNPVANVSIPVEAAKIVSTSFTTAAGMKAGLELAKNVPTIGAKAAVVIGTTIAAQTVNITASKIIKTTSSNKNDFIPVDMFQFFNENVDKSKIYEKYSEYPYNLIPDLNMYINIEIWFLIILVNVLLTAYLLEKKIEINKFVKNEKLRKFLNYMYNRYVSIWSVSRNLIVIWCILILFLCIFMSKLILFILLSE
jgi:hypothetical protein